MLQPEHRRSDLKLSGTIRAELSERDAALKSELSGKDCVSLDIYNKIATAPLLSLRIRARSKRTKSRPHASAP